MKNWKAVAGVVAVFVLGGLAGGLLTIGAIRHKIRHEGAGQVVADFIVRRLSWELRLESSQRDQLRVIVREGQQEMKAVRQQVQPQIDKILAGSEAKLRTILTPKQAEKFDKLIAERKARWAQSQGG